MAGTSLPYYLVFCPAVMLYSLYGKAQKMCNSIADHHHHHKEKKEIENQRPQHIDLAPGAAAY
jgi:hypothetical protein